MVDTFTAVVGVAFVVAFITTTENQYQNIFVTGFVKRNLIHASNSLTLRRIWNSACVWPTALKFDSRTYIDIIALMWQ